MKRTTATEKEPVMVNKSKGTRTRAIAGNVLIFLPGIAVLLSEAMKFLHVAAVVQQMASAGFGGGKLFLVATLGSTSAALFLYPRTRSIGLLLLSSFLGGAICTHVQQGKFAAGLAPSMLLALAWIGTYMRHPQMLWSFREFVSATSRAPEPGWPAREAL
jgi:DoxX-like family